MIRFCLLAALAMSLGWGLRGFIGGGPIGAMIPGAYIALLLALLLGRKAADAALIVAFGAIGIGFGGQETYGQTIGLSFVPDTHWWGLLGLGIKGAVWGLLGGAVIGVALERWHWSDRDIVIGVVLSIAATHLGWKLINEPKLIYFSNPFDRPREELWAGLLFASIALLAWLARTGKGRAPLVIGLSGMLFGFVGFGFGGWLQVIGRSTGMRAGIDWWKVMELTFGFLLGLGLALPVWLHRSWLQRPAGPTSDKGSKPWVFAAVALGVALFFGEELIPLRWNYTLLGGLLLILALKWPASRWQLAITATYCGFAIDLIEHWKAREAAWAWILVIITTKVVADYAAQPLSVRGMFLLIVWTSVFVSALKVFIPLSTRNHGAAFVMQALFVAMAIAITLLSKSLEKSPGEPGLEAVPQQ